MCLRERSARGEPHSLTLWGFGGAGEGGSSAACTESAVQGPQWYAETAVVDESPQCLLLANGVTGATIGFSDPFVEVELRGGDAPQSVRTAVINKSLNPEWNAQLGLYARGQSAGQGTRGPD